MPKGKVKENSAGQFVIEENGQQLVQKKKRIPGGYTKWNAKQAQKVCELITEGRTIQQIGKLKSMPDARTIYYWRRNYPEFKKASDQAREDRAEYFADKVVEVADDLTTKAKAPVAKVKIEAYRWRAGVDNPKQYGRSQGGDSGDKPLTIVINTGVQREEVIDVSQGDRNGVPAEATPGGTPQTTEEI